MSRSYRRQEPAPEPIAPDSLLEVCLCHHARRTARAVTRLFDDALRPSGLSAGQFNILAAIGARVGVSAADVARVLAMDPTTLSRNLKLLQRLGYLSVEVGAGRRGGSLSLTYGGRTAFNNATLLWREAQSRLFAGLGGSAAGAVLQALENLTRVATDNDVYTS